MNFRKKDRFKKVLTAFALGCGMLLFSSGLKAQDGEKLFKGNCAACHGIDKALVGPALKGVRERWADAESEDMMYVWIKDPKKAIASGNAYANKIKDFNPSDMNPQAVSDTDIDLILEYVENWAPAVTDTPKDDVVAEAPAPNYTLWFIIVGALLAVLALIMMGVRRHLSNALKEHEGKSVEAEKSFLQETAEWAGKNKVLVSIIVIALILGGTRDVWNSLMNIGVFTGYHPSQPIDYSHKVHTHKDNLNIECVYCHVGAEKGRHAGIPSPNICMNCHKGVSSGTTTGEKEIAKIYEAINFDTKTMSYGDPAEGEPIVWNKVHNLPDHVYFNHQQHYLVGKIECETCHGEVQEMGTIEQFAPLTMGWCVDCHRETEVQTQGSGYYEEIHARMNQGDKTLLKKILDDDKITVEELGGWECAKCHY